MKNVLFGKETKKLGFGLMRLPRCADGSIDVEQVKQMTDLFMQAGFTYFDTAWAYGGSEEAIREALVERYPRESYTLATKLNAWVFGCADEEEAKKQFTTSLERTGAGYFDFYLLHAIMAPTWHVYEDYHLWDYARELKEKGLVKHWGFSFHATPEILDEILTKYPDVDFVQLQLNYADWENPSVMSRANYEVARKHGKPIIVMEPVKGGYLADPPASVRKVFEESGSSLSIPSWAIRYVASLEGVSVVLSGMSTLDQMKDNISFMEDFRELNEEEKEVIAKAQAAIRAIDSIPCTACSYCTKGCPQSIPIPDIFKAMNKHMIYSQTETARADYRRFTKGKGLASDCVECRQCEEACPQSLPITDYLKKAAAVLEQA